LSAITVVGAGVVGRATGIGLATRGNDVRFVDVKPEALDSIRRAGFRADSPEAADWTAADITLLCVDTPTRGGRVDLGNLVRAVDTLAAGLAGSERPHTIVVRSTVPPGTTDGFRTRIEQVSGRTVDGRALGLGVIPEFLRQARADDDFLHPWIHVVGSRDEQTGDLLEALLAPFGAPIVRTDPKTAETIKYAHNLFNATKISFFNEFWLACARMGVDADVVSRTVIQSAEASWNPAYGSRGGLPYGGACLPKDTTAFLAYAGDVGLEMPLLAATIAVNARMERLVDGVGVPVMANGHDRQPESAAVGRTNGHIADEPLPAPATRLSPEPVSAGRTIGSDGLYGLSRLIIEEPKQD
jgi:UDPglucose 6-dehydrogenase